MKQVTTLGQFIIERQADFPGAKGELSRLLRDIGIASKIVNREVNKAGLVDILGEQGTTNIQGEDVKKLDVYANEQFISALGSGGETCAIASEENDDLVPITTKVSKDAKYVVCVDPLDGSSNIDVNVSIGTIFSIYRRTDSRLNLTMPQRRPALPRCTGLRRFEGRHVVPALPQMPNYGLSYLGHRLKLPFFEWSGVPVEPCRVEIQPVQPITQRDLDGPQVVEGWAFALAI